MNKDTSGLAQGKCDGAVRRYWKGMNERNVEFALAQFADEIIFQVSAQFRSIFNSCQKYVVQGDIYPRCRT